MNIIFLVLAVLIGITIAELDNPKRNDLPLVFPALRSPTTKPKKISYLRNEDEVKEINFRNIGLTARPYYRLPPFEEVPKHSRFNRDTLVQPGLPVDNNQKIENSGVNFQPHSRVNTVDHYQANLNPYAYNRMLGDISGHYRPRLTAKPPRRMMQPFDAHPDVYNNYGDQLAERMPEEFSSRIDGANERVLGDISVNMPYRHPQFNGKNGQGLILRRRNANSNAKLLSREKDDYEENEEYPHFPNHGEYF